MNKTELEKKVTDLRGQAIPLLKRLDELSAEAEKLLGDEERAYDYIWNGGNLRLIIRLIKLYEEKKWDEAGKLLPKIYGKGKQ